MAGGGGQVDTMLKITGKKSGVIKGESKATDHLEEIDILGWSFGVSRPIDAGTHQATGRRAWTDFTFTKRVDRSTPLLIGSCCTNEQVKVEMTVRTIGEKPIDSLKVTLDDALVRSVSTGAAGGTTMNETVAISFRKINIEYMDYVKDRMKGAKISTADEIHQI